MTMLVVSELYHCLECLTFLEITVLNKRKQGEIVLLSLWNQINFTAFFLNKLKNSLSQAKINFLFIASFRQRSQRINCY